MFLFVRGLICCLPALPVGPLRAAEVAEAVLRIPILPVEVSASEHSVYFPSAT